jgi:hypothetical protein
MPGGVVLTVDDGDGGQAEVILSVPQARAFALATLELIGLYAKGNEHLG